MAFDGDLEQYKEAVNAHREREVAGQARAFANVAELYSSKGETFGDDEVRQMLGEDSAPKIPNFPILIFGGAAIKDAVDFLDLTIVGAIAVFFFSVMFAIVLAFWSYGKISGGWWKKALIKKIFIRYGICMTIEMIPFIQIVPTTMVFVLLAHFHETKIAKLFNEGLEHLHGSGWGK